MSCEHAYEDADGYCAHHQRQKEYDRLVAEGARPCRYFFRGCNSLLTVTTAITCDDCIAKATKGKEYCNHPAGCKAGREAGTLYCGKHARDYYRDYEREHHVKVCNIDRGCFNICADGYKSCTQCIINNYIMNDRWFDAHIPNDNRCIICETPYESSQLSDGLKRCEECVAQFMHKSTNKVVLQLQSRSENNKQNRQAQYNEYVRGSAKRDLAMELTYDQFTSIVEQPCHYCQTIPGEHMGMGIDRVNNEGPYSPDNVVPCCGICNRMKGAMSIDEFINKCWLIHTYQTTGESYTGQLAEKYHAYMSKAVVRYKSYIDKTASRPRPLEFALTESDYYTIKKENCYLCGISSGFEHTNGIDRRDDSRGYIVDNCFPCCGHCNTLKFQIPIGILKYKVSRIVANEALLKYRVTIGTVREDEDAGAGRFLTRVLLSLFSRGEKAALIRYCTSHSRSDKFIHKISTLFDSRAEHDDFNLRGRIISMINCDKQVSAAEAATATALAAGEATHSHKKAFEVIAMLEAGKLREYLDWYESTYGPAHPFFKRDLGELLSNMSRLSTPERIAKCKHILYTQKNRRLAALRRENATPIPVACATTATPIDRTRLPLSTEQKQALAVISLPATPIVPSSVPSSTMLSAPEEDVPKQWKVNSIYSYIACGKDEYYRRHCIGNNNITTIPEWESRWELLTRTIKTTTLTDAETVIREFIEWLRNIRHNALCSKKQVEKEGRKVWTAPYISHLFGQGRIDEYKAVAEENTGDDPSDPRWMKRWAAFVASLEEAKDTPNKQAALISKFMAAQRAKKNRRTREHDPTIDIAPS
jgi:hypothetical protein